MRKLLLCCAAFAGAAALALATLAAPAEAPARELKPDLLAAGSPYLLKQIARRQRETWRWQRLMGKPRTRAAASARRSRDAEYRRWVLRLWTKRAVRTRRQAHNPPRERAWLCIHRYEGRWNDPHAPYWGGLQMDLDFQRLYGGDLLRRKGTADNWTPVEQMWVAERAYRSGRGFYPWPRTARACGLI